MQSPLMDRISHLSDLGEAQLLRQLNDAQLEIDRQRTATGTLELGMKELSHLHAQLNSITLQCTIIVGFALSGVGADTLSQLASDTGEFCMYKSIRAMTFTYLFVGFTLLSIFTCMTIVACSQKITAESNRCMMFEADVSLANMVVRQTKRLTDRICIAFEGALFLFFVDTVFALCLYFFTNNWVAATSDQHHIQQPPNDTLWNPELIYTNKGHTRVRCTDPYNEEQNQWADMMGSILAIVFIAVTVAFFFLYTCLRFWVVRQFSRDALQQLAARSKIGGFATIASRLAQVAAPQRLP